MKLVSQIVVVLAVLALIAGASFLLMRQSSTGGIQVVLPTSTSAPPVELKVYVSGAVRNPGVYTVNEGDRLDDVIEKAGGVTQAADPDAVNLAARVKDEDHWHIPKVGEVSQGAQSGQTAQNASSSGKININAADIEMLKTLPGIGDMKAEAIVRYRKANGPFSSVDDLKAVNGIGTATLEAVRDLVEAR